MKPCGVTSAVLTAVAACVAYAVIFWGGQQQRSRSEGGEEYELGSGKMFDSIAPRYDLINKVQATARLMMPVGRTPTP